MNNEEIEDLIQESIPLKTKLKGKSVCLKNAEDIFQNEKNETTLFESEVNHQSEEESLSYAKNIVKPAANYYISKFNTEGGDLYESKKALAAAQLFNLFFVKSKSVNALYLLADDLKYFGFQAFTTAFIGELKKEIPVVIDESNKDFDWNAIGNSKQFKTRSQKRAKRRKLNDDINADDWRCDPGEKSCRIWEWWKVRIYEIPNPKLAYFALGIRLIVLTQVSSCAIERVFSQLKLIRDVCGDNMLEDSYASPSLFF